MQNTKTILWDWNGTLLNDTHICIDAINILLRERTKEEIDEEIYRDIFTFPVRDYYVKAGFDFNQEPFEKPAIEFIEYYEELVKQADLFDDARETLEKFRDKGFNQLILSAMQHDSLNKMVSDHGIDHFFSKISGIEDHYAAGKADNGRKLIAGLDGDAGEIIMLGDTIHDHEVAEELDVRVILIARGHQSEARLKKTARTVVRNFKELSRYI